MKQYIVRRRARCLHHQSWYGGVCSVELDSIRRRISINIHMLPACGLDAYGRAGAGCEPDASTKTVAQLPAFDVPEHGAGRVQSKYRACAVTMFDICNALKLII